MNAVVVRKTRTMGHKMNEQDQTTSGTPGQAPPFQISGKLIGWGIAALALAVFVCTFNTSPMVLGASLMAKIFAIAVGTVLGLAGALIGDAIRKFAHPDAVFTTGGALSLIWIRLFWLFGPQTIGLGVGTVLGASLVLG